jgi:hypothetical protein
LKCKSIEKSSPLITDFLGEFYPFRGTMEAELSWWRSHHDEVTVAFAFLGN